VKNALLLFLAGLATSATPRASLDAAAPRIATGELGPIVAVEVEQHGKTVWARRFDNRAIGEPVDIRSAGKSLTALAVGIAIAEGKLSGTEAKVWPLLGAASTDPHADITVRDLLTMSSALDCDDGVRASPGQEERMYRTRNWTAFAMQIPIRRGYQRDAQGFGPFHYCTSGVFLLGRLIEKVTGEPFDQYLAKRVLAPLAITRTVWRRSPIGEVQAGGQLAIGAADLAKIGRLVLDRGCWQGRQLLPAAWTREMLHPWRQPSAQIFYGYLWWAMPVRGPSGYEGAWMMMGNGGNIVALFGKSDAVAVVQATAYNRAEADRHSFDILESALVTLAERSAQAQSGRASDTTDSGSGAPERACTPNRLPSGSAA
jgi:CubicO group peptidase (beta-lactamase class C family)